MYECPNGCVKSDSKMIFRGNTYECPVCHMKGRWYPKRIKDKDGHPKPNPEGHPYVIWDNGKKTVNRGA
jgi:hypothetical protein